MKLDITTAKMLASKIRDELKNQILAGKEITEEFATEIIKFKDSDDILTKEQIENASLLIILNNMRLKTYSEYYSIFSEAVDEAVDDSFEEFLINVLIQS